MQKYILFLLALFIYSCSNYSASPNINTQKKTTISNEPLPKNKFIKNYKSYKISIYKKHEKQKLEEQLYNNSLNFKMLNRNDIFNLVGSPYLIKQEGNLELWQYRSSNCIINFFWEKDSIYVSSIKSYLLNLKTIKENQCVKIIIKERMI